MADKQISFSIQVEGNEKILKNLTEAQKAVKELNKELKATEDQDVYEQKEKELVKAKAALSEFRKEQKNQIREFKASQTQAGSYEQLNAQLVRARQEFKKLSKAEREGATGKALTANIQSLDKELKDLDKSIGQNQRNVGNYEEAITNAFSGAAGQIAGTISGFKGIGQAAKQAGSLISKAFVAFQAIQILVEAVGYVEDFTEATIEAQKKVEVTFGTIGQATDEAVVKIQALADTIGKDLDPVLQATNSIVSEFGGEAVDATDLLAKGIKSVADESKFLSLVENNLQKVSAAGLNAEEAVSLLAEVTNRGINVDVISKGIANLRTQTDATKDSIENAFGKERADEIFEVFTDKPAEAVKIISQELQTLNQNSKEAGEVINNVFGRSGKEDLTTIKNIATLNLNIDELAEKSGIAGQRFDALREANEEFAAAQVDVANALKGSIGNSEAFTTNLKAGLLRVLSEVIKSVQPLIDAFKNLFAAFKTGSDNISLLQKGAQLLTANFKIIAGVLAAVINFVVELGKGVADLAKEWSFLGLILDTVSGAFSNVTTSLSQLPNIIAGVQSAATQLAKNIKTEFQSIFLDLEIFAKKAEQLLSFGEADAAVQRQIDELRARQEELNAERITVIEAFKKGFEESKQAELDAQKKADEEAKNEAVRAEKEKQQARAAERAKGNAKARRKAEEEAAKELEALRKAQQKFIQEQSKLELERAALLLELGKRVRDNQIALLEDAGEARRATIEAQYADELEALQQQADAVAAAQEEREQKAIELFGENSQEVINLRNQQAQDLAKILNDITVLETQALEKRNKDLVDLEKDLAEQRQAVREKELNDNLADIDSASSLEQLKLRQRFADGLITEQEYTEQSTQLTLDRLQAQIDAYNEELNELKKLRAQGIAINEEYFRELEQKVQESQTEQSEIVRQSQDEREAERLERFQNQVDQIGGFVQQGIQQIDAIYANISAREIERIEQRRAAQEEELTILQEQLEQSSGLQRVALQQQVDQEIKEKKRLEKEQERIEKREANRRKAFAIAQVAINLALELASIAANAAANPANATTFGAAGVSQAAILAGIAIANSAIQVAAISSQQFAKGGILDGPSHAQGGIKTRFGELEGGEAVINKRSTAMFKPMLSKINEAGGGRKFAVGGVLSSPIVAPTSAETELNAFTNALGENFDAINNRFDRMQVVLNTDEEEREAQDRQENINIATLTTDNG